MFLDDFPDVFGYDGLLFLVLGIPFGRLDAIHDGEGTCQCYGLPVLSISAQQDFGRTAQPCARYRGVAKINHHARIVVASLHKGFQRRKLFIDGAEGRTRKHQLLEFLFLQRFHEPTEGRIISVVSFRLVQGRDGSGCLRLGVQEGLRVFQRGDDLGDFIPIVCRNIGTDKYDRMLFRLLEGSDDEAFLSVQSGDVMDGFHLS